MRTNDVKKVLDILAMRYNIVNVYVNGDEIIVDQPVNSDELAWVLYNERVFVSGSISRRRALSTTLFTG